MKRPVFTDKLMIRSTGRAKLALDRVVADLRADPGVRWFGGKVTQEAVVNATWLWLEEVGAEAAREIVTRHAPRLEAILSGAADPGPAEGPGGYLRPLRPGIATPEESAGEPDDLDPPPANPGRRATRPE